MIGKQARSVHKKPHQTPWYKVPMLWLVVGIPVLAITVSLSYVTLSFRASDTVVRDDWYMDGKTLKQDLSRDVLAAELGLTAELSMADTGRLELSLSGHSGKFTTPKQLTLSLYHATEKSGDATARLNKVGNTKSVHNYLGQLAGAAKLRGKYYFELTDGVWRLRSEVVMPKGSVSFKPLEVYEKLTAEQHVN